ncbi:2,5-diketo-D-gluconic acid reductase A [Nannizzia gypsea CBS 118893]|uniref:D-xylose reductase [NAD(P)H] n=1 Tax=Arthroderma gypseum (strain ATCC MYA-4604 / CBS 118893) TaxID=535722 RepID=E4UTV8_ARTGP|nr:2,5-diketo-D-gluconic acid reductase A [Nannizzia gypsea CBS 118893]EFR00764.1 2,5-diketo-D-gluconic acid reductase A [Nannizzia gypsea CBS 118893]
MSRPIYSITDTVPLPNSTVRIPRLGFGTCNSPTNLTEKSCLSAIRAGYRSIDTLQIHRHEAEIGRAVRSCGVDRKDLFLTIKVRLLVDGAGGAYDFLVESVEKLSGKGGYVDMMMIHWPHFDDMQRRSVWLTLEYMLEKGFTKAIGVCNYSVEQLEEMRSYADIWPPHFVQLELNPWSQYSSIVEYCKMHDIVVGAYCSLTENTMSTHPVLLRLAEKYNKTASQVLVRYSLQKGYVPFPKSDNPDHIKENADVFDFDIVDDDMAILDKLEGPNPRIDPS